MDEYDLERLFYENTKEGDFTRVYKGKYPSSWTEIEYLEYPRFEHTEIDFDSVKLQQSFDSILRERSSPQEYTGEAVSQRQLAGILLGATETHQHPDGERSLRAYPSAGARYPLEVYVAVSTVEDLKPGLYHLNISEETLELIHDRPLNADLAQQSGQSLPTDAALIIIITAFPERTRRKYGLRGYRYLLFEAGHLMQNLLLGAQAVGVSGRPWGAFLESDIEGYLDLSSTDEEPIYVGVFGEAP